MNRLIVLLLTTISLHAESFYSWHPQQFIWNLGIALSCDVKPDGTPNIAPLEHDPHTYIFPNEINDGDIIWIQAPKVPIFLTEIFPYIKSRFILVINDGDKGFPSEVLKGHEIKKLVKSNKVIHIFAQNFDLPFPLISKKISHLPIGIDYHTLMLRPEVFHEDLQTQEEQEKNLNAILATLVPTKNRIKGALLDFHFNNSSSSKRFGEDRKMITEKLKSLHLPIEFLAKPLPRHELWAAKGQYAFSISPHGNGLDCHRTWEDLILGCIVIVKSSPLDPLYEGLPVVIVKEWYEITPANLDLWLERYGDAFTNPEYRKKLTHRYWMDKITAYKKSSK